MKAVPRLMILLSILLIHGCATTNNQFSKQKTFNEESPRGLVVLGVDISGFYKSPSLNFLQYNPETMDIIPGKIFKVKPRTDHLSSKQKVAAYLSDNTNRPGGHNYFVQEMPPGNWFLACVAAEYRILAEPKSRNSTCLQKGTIAFQVAKGQATYIGELKIKTVDNKQLNITLGTNNFTSAINELKKFSGVKTELIATQPISASFKCKKPSRSCNIYSVRYLD